MSLTLDPAYNQVTFHVHASPESADAYLFLSYFIFISIHSLIAMKTSLHSTEVDVSIEESNGQCNLLSVRTSKKSACLAPTIAMSSRLAS